VPTNVYLIHTRHLRTTYPRANGVNESWSVGKGKEEEEKEDGGEAVEGARTNDSLFRACEEDERGCSRRTFTKTTESSRYVGESPILYIR